MRVCVEVEHKLLQLFQVKVQLESGVTGSESCHKDVDVTIVGLILLEVGIDDFKRSSRVGLVKCQ